MKAFMRVLLVFAVVAGAFTISRGQTRKERQAAKQAEVKKMVEDGRYVFSAEFANPQTGGQRHLTSEYDLKVSKDSVIAYLPYFGVAHLAPNPGETEGGIKFTSTKFEYSAKQKKNGNWDVFIKPADKNITDWRDVQQMRLNISPNGYASLQVISSNRDPINFDGYIVTKN